MDEKQMVEAEIRPLLPQRSRRHPRTPTATVLGLINAGLVLGMLYLWWFNKPVQLGHEKKPAPWSWKEMKPSHDLEWEKCYDDEFECARLDVPMDWLDPTQHERVVLGVIKLAAKTKPGQLSPVFVNPGGPGGSGVRFVQRAGRLLQTIVGDNHDIISFDPRGVGVSTPRVECWGSSQKRNLWALQDTPVVDQHPGLAYDAYARAVAYSGACEAAMNETGILRHLSTASHARDMLAMLDKTGHAKLRYWGFSYGTVLGGVFAGLYPERVERLVSDGNCDYHDWFELDHTNFVSDTDLIFDAFDEACYGAGPAKCTFWASSPQAIQDRRSALLTRLKTSPILIPAWSRPTGPSLPELVTYSKVQLLTRGVLYKPLSKFPRMAAVYAALDAGDGLPYYDMVRENGDVSSEEWCALGDTPAMTPLETGTEEDAFPAIMCSDGEPTQETAEEFVAYTERMGKMSRWAGAANTLFHVVCLGRTVRPKWRFKESDFQGDTAHPILFIGNQADNVTPLQSAYNNSARFPSSVVLKQNSYGHCSLAAASTCTARHIRAYFQNGTLPPDGTECEPDYKLFELPDAEEAMAQQMGELESAVWGLAEVDVGMASSYAETPDPQRLHDHGFEPRRGMRPSKSPTLQKKIRAVSEPINAGPAHRLLTILCVWAMNQKYLGRLWKPSAGVLTVCNICIKVKPFDNLAEAHAMQFVMQHTSIPVPKVYCAFVHSGKTFIVMQRIKGEMAWRGWLNRPAQSKKQILDQLSQMMATLRSIPPPETTGIASVDGGPIFDCRLPEQVGGPYATTRDFHQALANGVDIDTEYTNLPPEVSELFGFYRHSSDKLVFTHGDLSSLNVMVRDDEVVGIIDWETAGWFPPYWEYTCAKHVNPYNTFWADECLSDPFNAVPALHLRRSGVWSETYRRRFTLLILATERQQAAVKLGHGSSSFLVLPKQVYHAWIVYNAEAFLPAEPANRTVGRLSLGPTMEA
ncbi:hypothetical protein G7046_g8019 [Stylonectria norvegica]|nr:hypothetical protein G7046_g8019 [Stylonectria norvegica]